jgi:hypothetical protein
MDKGESVGPYVARALDIVDRSGLPYKLGPLGTCIEGEWPDVMQVVQASAAAGPAGPRAAGIGSNNGGGMTLSSTLAGVVRINRGSAQYLAEQNRFEPL